MNGIESSVSIWTLSSWLSVTDESRFLEVKAGKRILHYKTIKFPCRSLVEEYPESVPVEQYDINEDIAKLSEINKESDEWVL